MADWSPATYLKFEDERTRPARDLLAQVRQQRPRRVADMGCGPGNSTELLVERFPEAEVIGLDSSPNMLADARLRVPTARFEAADAQTWSPAPGTDVVFANAIYQWLPEHIPAFQRVLQGLESGGTLAVQMPDNMAEPSHVLMREVAASGPWAERLEAAARLPLPPVGVYYDALRPHAARLEIWHSIYNHVLADAAAIVEWVKATGLRPFIDPLQLDERVEFLSRYHSAIEKAYTPTADGKVLLRFPRLFIVAER
ncbi:MAG TPA: trans-aconitate 2-methyltransferase [Arsenicitalea sp.]|jgi:trans-aconitate 2-methyltransferase|nr:trans-aconitate 2-methyltransferase [Arsenicitalea sp.]